MRRFSVDLGTPGSLSRWFLLLVVLWIPNSLPLQAAAPKRFEFSQPHMGTLFRLIIHAKTSQEANQGALQAFLRIEELEQTLSHYRDDSELNRLCALAFETPQVVSPDLFQILRESHKWSRLSGGAFDVTVRPLVTLWRSQAGRGRLPSPQELTTVRRRVGYRKISYNSILRSVGLTVEGLTIDLGAIGKGFAADAALEVLYAQGLRSALVDAGGDLRLGDPPPGEKGWTVSVAPGPDVDPSNRLLLSNCAVATSSDDFQFFEIDEKRYSHIIDPVTGLGVEHGGLASVVAPQAAGADALATALSVMGPITGIALLESLDGIEGRFLQRSGSAAAVVHQTEGFGALGSPP